jgi:tRNA-binding protein
MSAEELTWEQFEAVEMRVGRITKAEEFPEARQPAYKLEVDFGPQIGSRQSSAQITNYDRSDLEGRLVVGVINFPPKQIGPVRSQVLVLGAVSDDGVVTLIAPDEGAALGERIA